MDVTWKGHPFWMNSESVVQKGTDRSGLSSSQQRAVLVTQFPECIHSSSPAAGAQHGWGRRRGRESFRKKWEAELSFAGMRQAWLVLCLAQRGRASGWPTFWGHWSLNCNGGPLCNQLWDCWNILYVCSIFHPQKSRCATRSSSLGKSRAACCL